MNFGLNLPFGSKKENITLEERELKEYIRKSKGALRIGAAFAVLGLLLLLFTFCLAGFGLFYSFSYGGFSIFGGIIFFIAGVFIIALKTAALKNRISSSLLPPVLNEVFESFDYRVNSHISEDVIRHTDMGFPFDIERISGSDFIKAKYNGVNIELSDISIYNTTMESDGKGNMRKKEVKVFQGLWLVCDFGKTLSADVRISERTALGKKFAIGGIKTENEVFNKRFYIKSESPHDVFYILTPHMMEYIITAVDKARGDAYMRFLKSGRVHIAINSGRDSFEIHNPFKIDLDRIVARFKEELCYITDLIDELRLVDTLYKK